MPTISLRDIQAIDVHAHPFSAYTKTYSEMEFVQKLSLAVVSNQVPSGYVRAEKQPFPGTNMWMQILIRRLARYLGCEPSLEAVVNQRNLRAKDYTQYTRGLFANARVTGIVADFGYPTPRIPKDEFTELTNCRIWEIHRIETSMVRLRNECSSFGEFAEKYRAELKEALRRPDVVGLKSIIAYRSGLDIGDKKETDAAGQFPEFQVEERAEVKALRDFCFHLAMEECTSAQKYMHIHTGIGDGEVVLPKASPGFLLSTLRDRKYAETKVHLVHGGYPWIEEAAFIVSVLPNVYMDISLQNPFAGHGVERILSQVYEFAPFDKVMYGSDAFTVPEMNWMGVHLFKECFERVLSGWVNDDWFDAGTAQAIGEMVLYRNFENAYGIRV